MMAFLGADGRSSDAINNSIGKIISSAELLSDDRLYISLNDGTTLVVFDDGQSCCEHRYMRTDDDLSAAAGSKFLGVEVKEAPDIEGDGDGTHEVRFLEIQTDRGCFTMASHNEHNGYYDGFIIRAYEVTA